MPLMNIILGNSYKTLFITMAWIFDACPDQYGQCLRQYIAFCVGIVIMGLSLYSCFKTYRLENKVTFQLLPLSINFLTSTLLVAFYSQIEWFNTRLILLIIEAYSYFLITYGFVFTVMKQSPFFQERRKILTRFFIFASILSVALLIGISALSLTHTLSCRWDQGYGTIALVIVEIILMVTAYVYSSKLVKMTEQSTFHIDGNPTITEHLIQEQDQQIKLKIIQMNLVRFAFVFSLVLHFMEISVFYIGKQDLICDKKTNQIEVTGPLPLYILVLENISELFPHFIIPFIFWYLTSKIALTVNSTCILEKTDQKTKESYRYRTMKEDSRLVLDVRNQQNIREKISPKKIGKGLQER